MNLILDNANMTWLIPVLIVGVFALIVIIVIVVKKKFKVFQDKEQPKSDKEIAAEELDRLLEPVDELIEKKEDTEGK